MDACMSSTLEKHAPSAPTQEFLEFFRDANGKTLAFVLRSQFSREKYNFVTPPESGLQVGVSFYGAGETIQPHLHVEREKTVTQSQECIIVRKGEMTFYVFDAERNLVGQTTLVEGDVAFQYTGGHAFKVRRDSEIVEVKQGPFGGDVDKIRFESPLP